MPGLELHTQKKLKYLANIFNTGTVISRPHRKTSCGPAQHLLIHTHSIYQMMLSDSNFLFTLHKVQVTSVQSEWEYLNLEQLFYQKITNNTKSVRMLHTHLSFISNKHIATIHHLM